MNDPNTNDLITNNQDSRREELQDRLTEQQLREAFNAETPPDLSSQILAAADRPADSAPTAPQPTRVAAAPASAKSSWRDLAIAACLLVLIGGGVSLVAVSNYQAQRQPGVAQRFDDPSLKVVRKENPTPPTTAQNVVGDVDGTDVDDVGKTVSAEDFAADAPESPKNAIEIDTNLAAAPIEFTAPLDEAQAQQLARQSLKEQLSKQVEEIAGVQTDFANKGQEYRRLLETNERAIKAVQTQALREHEKSLSSVESAQKRIGALKADSDALATQSREKRLKLLVAPRVVNQPLGEADLLGQVIAEEAGRGIDAVHERTAVITESTKSDINEAIERARRTRLTDPQQAEQELTLAYGIVIDTPDIDPQVKKEVLAKLRNELAPATLKKIEAELGTGPGDPGDQYSRIVENEFLSATDRPLSTFSIDVDTASYANVRQFLLQGRQLPPPDAVRIEELVNYFDYEYAGPQDDTPFASHMEVGACPWQPKHRLLRIALKGKEVDYRERPNSNLVFLIDVSGSMQDSNKLPLCVAGMKLLASELNENDRVAIVVYANSEGLVLPSTPGARKDDIIAALDRLRAGGSTNGGAGIQLAYQVAQDNFIKGGINRVILCTDGDFNVGTTSTGELQRMAEEKAKTGVFLTVLGFGRGNLNDAMMETISNKGNGNYAYIDGLTEAKKVLIEQISGTLMTIAKDVKIQVEFNPAEVFAYRLIGYENRVMAAEDFNDDRKDAGEIGAGHTVTALYEIVPHPTNDEKPTAETGDIDALKYQRPAGLSDAAANGELLTLKLRYKQPDGETSRLLQFPLKDDGKKFGQASEDFKFASSVAAFGMLLRGSQYAGKMTVDAVLEIAQSSKGQDKHGYRAEFLELARAAKRLGK
jgi:Ca-activated chloride channel family protein